MRLFDRFQRTDGSPARDTESAFEFLNRSSWQSVGRIRETMEHWFERYPSETADRPGERSDLHGRYRSRRNRNHYGAFFELFIHELLLRLDCRVVVHPRIPLRSARPDFCVFPLTGEPFYLEATVATGTSAAEEAGGARTATVRDAVDQIKTKNFFLLVRERGTPRTPPKGAAIRAFLQRKLDELDPDEVAQAWEQEGQARVPTWTFTHDGWTAIFQPIPKEPEARAYKTERPIGGSFGPFRRVDGVTPVREALLAKGQHLGNLDRPLVVAVNALSWDTERADVLEALFGANRAPILGPAVSHAGGPESLQGLNGLWTSPGGPRYTRIVGVLVAQMLYPWTVCRPADLRVYSNPYVASVLPVVLSRLAQAVPGDNGNLEYRDGEPLAEILGLAEDWPEMGQKV